MHCLSNIALIQTCFIVHRLSIIVNILFHWHAINIFLSFEACAIYSILLLGDCHVLIQYGRKVIHVIFVHRFPVNILPHLFSIVQDDPDKPLLSLILLFTLFL